MHKSVSAFKETLVFEENIKVVVYTRLVFQWNVVLCHHHHFLYIFCENALHSFAPLVDGELVGAKQYIDL